jgi:hypothetical protein
MHCPTPADGLIIDIQKRMAEDKGPAYERWVKAKIDHLLRLTDERGDKEQKQ